jgi:hypothetical protein
MDGVLPLSAQERARRYRELAAFARHNATEAMTTEARLSYLTLASQWERLAEQAEQPSDYYKDGTANPLQPDPRSEN